MKIHNMEQGGVDWSIMRSGKVTASGMDSLITPLGKVRTGEGVKTYMTELLAERWIGGPLPAVQGVWDLDQGKILEEYARPAFTLETGLEVATVGFIEHDNGRMGASPDGLVIGRQAGLEIKCPHIENHIRYLLDGKVPQQYVAQVQFSMLVTGYPQWYFCSFRRSFPPLVVLVDRDDKFHAAMEDALAGFFADLDAAYKRLCELNGGPPPSKQTSMPLQYEPETSDKPDVGN
jgi:hypothetical protein